MKEQGWLRMEKIDTDCKRRIWKIDAKLFNMSKLWRSSSKATTAATSLLELLHLCLPLMKSGKQWRFILLVIERKLERISSLSCRPRWKYSVVLNCVIHSHSWSFCSQAVNGQAIDRHLLGMKLAAIESRMNLPELFMDSSYQYALHYKLSTSQVRAARICLHLEQAKRRIIENFKGATLQMEKIEKIGNLGLFFAGSDLFRSC